MNEEKEFNTLKKPIVIIWIIFNVFAFGIAIWIIASNIKLFKEAKEHDVPYTGDAILTSEEFVKSRLDAPEAAEFPPWYSSDVTSTELGKNRYEVISYFDVENAHGDTARTHYVAVLKYEGNDRWTLESLDFN